MTDGNHAAATVAEILKGVRARGFEYLDRLAGAEPVPVVRGREILFVYHDPHGAVKSVRLVHHVSGVIRSPKFAKVNGAPLHLLHMVLPEGARLEYTFRISYRDGGEEVRTDPLNPAVSWCPFGPTSVVTTSQYRVPPWSIPRPGVPAGRLEEHAIESRHIGSRGVVVYVPAAEPLDDGYPVLVVHDGGDYRQYAGFVTVLDNLIAEGAIPPLLALLTLPGNRNEEYSCTPEHPDYVADDLLPWVRDRWPVNPAREATGLMGSSFGAVASVYAAFRYPEVFGRLLLQSGSFFFHQAVGLPATFEPVDEFDRIRRFLEGEFFPGTFARPMRAYVSCGTFESHLSLNRDFAEILRRQGHEVMYRETHDGHNWVSWRDHLGDALSYLFAP